MLESDMRICLSLYGTTEEICDEIALNPNADLFEVRLDLSAEVQCETIRKATTKPLIFTSHGKPELLPQAAKFADHLDVGSTPANGPEYIASIHEHEADPLELWRRLSGEHITKIVLDTKDYSKIAALLELNRTYHPNALCFAMGETGAFSRILSVLYGAPWVYAAGSDRSTAIGQFTVGELIHTYRLRRFIEEPEAVFGIVGNPVSHSRSPHFHNAKFAQADLPWIYLPFHCEDLPSLFKIAWRFGVKGFSITHPFKEKVLPLLHTASHDVKKLKSCNTVMLKDGKWHGINTDIAGLTTVLVENQIQLLGARAVILGAGGAARTIASVVRPHVADLLFLNRTLSKARALASKYSGRAGLLQDFGNQPCDVLFNATPVGWNDDECPINPGLLQKGTTVIDAIYQPTTLLRKARALGCRAINGESWFTAQAEAQFRWWKENF